MRASDRGSRQGAAGAALTLAAPVPDAPIAIPPIEERGSPLPPATTSNTDPGRGALVRRALDPVTGAALGASGRGRFEQGPPPVHDAGREDPDPPGRWTGRR